MRDLFFLYIIVFMMLSIDTSNNEIIKLALEKDGQLVCVKKIEAKYRQSEKLLVSIDEMLRENGIVLNDLEQILVNESGEGFSSLRIGIVTANALAYALGIPVADSHGIVEPNSDGFGLVRPQYAKEPNIGK